MGLRIKSELLNLYEIVEKDETYLILMIFPGEPYRPFINGWGVSFEVKKIDYPELIGAKQGFSFYVSGKIQEATTNSIFLEEVKLLLN